MPGIPVAGNARTLAPMTTVVERCRQAGAELVFVCDFSPPRGGDPALMAGAADLPADFISVASGPGRSPRVSSAAAAHWIASSSGRDVVFTVSTRDMNRMAIQAMLLGADLLGLRNVCVVGGDPYRADDLEWAVPVRDYRPTELVSDIRRLNAGVDFRGLSLRSPTDLCAGATIDLGRDLGSQVALTRRKVESGAEFFLLQALFEPALLDRFEGAYADAHGEEIGRPIFCGVQVLTPGGVTFGRLPAWASEQLDGGRDGVAIATHLIERYAAAGRRNVYLVPPIMRGGRRDYEAAGRVLRAFGR